MIGHQQDEPFMQRKNSLCVWEEVGKRSTEKQQVTLTVKSSLQPRVHFEQIICFIIWAFCLHVYLSASLTCLVFLEAKTVWHPRSVVIDFCEPPGVDPGSSGRGISSLNCWATSPAPPRDLKPMGLKRNNYQISSFILNSIELNWFINYKVFKLIF